MPPRYLVRACAVWLLIALAETLHGTLRTLWLVPRIGDLASRQVGVFTGSAIIFAIAWMTERWIGASRTGDRIRIGLLWLVLMLAFEIGLGRAFGFSWDRILADYDPRQGGLMLLGMSMMVLSPLLAARGHASAFRRDPCRTS